MLPAGTLRCCHSCSPRNFLLAEYNLKSNVAHRGCKIELMELNFPVEQVGWSECVCVYVCVYVCVCVWGGVAASVEMQIN